MHLETTNKICALCKRLVATNGHAVPARLCEECRSLIQTILPNAGSGPASAVEQARGVALPQFAAAGIAQPALAGPASLEEDLDDVEITSQPDRWGLASFDPVADFDELQSDRITDIETGYLDEFGASDEAAGVTAEAMPRPFDEAVDLADEPDGQQLEVFMMSEQPGELRHDAVTLEPPPSEESQNLNLSPDEGPAQSTGLRQAAEANAQADSKVEAPKNAEAITETVKGADPTGDEEAASYREAIDPWDDPLPAWEHSRNEYPLYVGITERKQRFKLKTLLVPAALLACLVAAYFIFLSSGRGPKDGQAVVETGEVNPESSSPVAAPQAPNSPTSASDEAQPVAPTSPDVPTAPDAPTAASAEKTDAASPSATANVGAETQWRYALQALASQSAEEADAFAERVKGAGIPAYVISADIANRGRWFRVRVGGFNTAQEAQRFAAEARARARSAGVALKDLNVVDYVKP
ncbi:MAG TPA: SPOR domain-containing protein [Blastocatellia bacterium]|nr:SPOR domain-containing protein [Blastocatellia bacterium]